jgi:hypothetical protein
MKRQTPAYNNSMKGWSAFCSFPASPPEGVCILTGIAVYERHDTWTYQTCPGAVKTPTPKSGRVLRASAGPCAFAGPCCDGTVVSIYTEVIIRNQFHIETSMLISALLAGDVRNYEIQKRCPPCHSPAAGGRSSAADCSWCVFGVTRVA